MLILKVWRKDSGREFLRAGHSFWLLLSSPFFLSRKFFSIMSRPLLRICRLFVLPFGTCFIHKLDFCDLPSISIFLDFILFSPFSLCSLCSGIISQVCSLQRSAALSEPFISSVRTVFRLLGLQFINIPSHLCTFWFNKSNINIIWHRRPASSEKIFCSWR